MSLFDVELRDCRRWLQVGDSYEVTRKPRGLDTSSLVAIPFASMADIPQGGVYAPEFTLKAQTEIKSGTYFERGDILVAKITPSFENGKQALTTGLPTPFGFATTEVIPLRPRTDRHDRRLLFFYLLHPDVRHHVAERMEGTTGRQRVPEEVLLDLPFPEFEPEEQIAVSDSLEMIQRLVVAETKSVQAAIALKRATMRTLFTCGLRGEVQKETEIGPVPASWVPTPIVSIGLVKGGKRMPKGVSLTDENTGKPYIRVTDFQDHSIAVDQVLFVPKGYEDVIARYVISSDNIYISIAGTIGLVGQVPNTLDGANLTENAAKICVTKPDVIARYVMYALASEMCQVQIAQAIGKNAQPKLALARVEQIKLPLPTPRDEQHEIVTVLDAIDRKIDLHQRKRKLLDDLFKALLHKLMTGEIRVADLDLSALTATEENMKTNEAYA